ncbi:MAG: glutamate 5-kinase [Candidatus Kerfeldbacteria bacterium]|nr:glutamate 5-kinase [Candidatus Kerfeldbacteria bacterium]
MKGAIVIKIGSNSLLDTQGNIDQVFLRRVVDVLKGIQSLGKFPLLVLSGAVSTGKADASALVSYGARAARGQLIITALMYQLGEEAGVKFGQFLISRQDIIDRGRYNTLQKTFQESLSAGVVPLINENDATAAAQTHNFVDNDQLAAIVGVVINADKLFLLTNVAGVFRTDPNKDNQSEQAPIARITDVNKELMSLHLGKKSLAGRGGMEAKLRAARLASFVGLTTYIINAQSLENVVEVIQGGKCYGTVCLPWPQPLALTERSRRLIVSNTSSACIKVDTGAAKALRARKSLLAVGVTRVYGTFDVQDSVEIIDHNNHPVALGVSALSSVELGKIITAKDRPFNVEVIHADNLILFPL